MRVASTTIAALLLAATALAGGTKLSGVVKDHDGKPMAGVTVRVAPADRSKGYRPVSTETDAKGRFTLQTEEAGTHTVSIQSVKKDDRFVTSLPDLEIAGGEQEVSLTLSKCAISGKVTCRDTKKPPEEMSVALYRVKPWTLAGTAFTNEKGAYLVRGFPPGKYRLIATLDGYRRATCEVDIKKGKRKKGVDILLERLKAGTVEFMVTDEEGKGLAGVRFSYQSEPGMTSTLSAKPVDDVPGLYVCEQLEEGTWKVYVSCEERQSKQIEVKVKEGKKTKLDVTLPPK